MSQSPHLSGEIIDLLGLAFSRIDQWLQLQSSQLDCASDHATRGEKDVPSRPLCP